MLHRVRVQGRGVDGRCGRAADSGAVAGVSNDAGNGDRGADRLAPARSGCSAVGWRSCGRRIHRRIGPGAPAMSRAGSPSVICGSRRSPHLCPNRPGRSVITLDSHRSEHAAGDRSFAAVWRAHADHDRRDQCCRWRPGSACWTTLAPRAEQSAAAGRGGAARRFTLFLRHNRPRVGGAWLRIRSF